MPKPLDWDSRIGRRVRLRDLHILFAAVQHGSMAKAGSHLGMSQSAVSQAIAALEHAVRVRLVDRTPRGVEPTLYGTALMKRGQAAFDELRSGIRDIESLADPRAGEVRVACTESIAAGILPPVIDSFSRRHPGVRLEVIQTSTHLIGFAALHERRADLVLTLLPRRFEPEIGEGLQAEKLFEDRICVALAARHPLARKRRVRIADLAGLALISPSSDTPGGAAVAEALRAAGLPESRVRVTTLSIHLRAILAMRNGFAAVLPASVLRFNPAVRGLRELRLDMAMPQPPALLVTLENRTLSPPVERFIECARELAQLARKRPSYSTRHTA